MTATYVYSTILVSVDCGDCGIPHGLPQNLQAARAADGGSWYCPNGHRISYHETESQKYKRLYKAAEDRRAAVAAERDQAQASLRATKGVVTKLRNRTAAGECPFCGAHVYQLSRHVTRQHAAEAAEAIAEPEPVA